MLQPLETRTAGAPRPAAPPAAERTVADALVHHLQELGVEEAFGVSGGAIALLYDAIAESSIALRHFRQESGAAFAAAEAYFASDKPAVVFATTGPGILNALTGVTAARWDGAKVILISGSTNARQRGRWASQETSSYTLPTEALFTQGPIFDYAVRVEQASELAVVARRLALGIGRPGGFVAHVSLPMSVQSSRIEPPAAHRTTSSIPTVCPGDVAYCAELLREGRFAIWVGHGARGAAPQVRQLAERTGAAVLSTPRGKGIFPESHPQHVGVTGLGGHEAVSDYMLKDRPRWTLVLGTRLGEASSFWDDNLLPSEGLIHVDLDPDVPGTAFPDAQTVGVRADVGAFLDSLLAHFPAPAGAREVQKREVQKVVQMPGVAASRHTLRDADEGAVRPQVLMEAIQRQIVDRSDAVVLAECGNAFAWCNHHLRFPAPGRYRVSSLFGSMGHCAAGVVGAALARGGKAVAVLGDGSMLMNSELSTAAQYGAQAVWIILNDAAYGMCVDGLTTLGLSTAELEIPRVDFVGFARAVGADGIAVDAETELASALDQAMAADGPFVVDIRIDAEQASPLLARFQSLIRQGASKSVAGWDH